MDQLAEYSWSYFCYSPLITSGSAGRVHLVTLLLLSTHNPWISLQSRAGHTSVTLHSSPVDQLAEYSCSHFCYSPLITCGSAGRVLMVKLRLLATQHPWNSWQSTAVKLLLLSTHNFCRVLSTHLHHFPWISWQSRCYSPLITRGSVSLPHFCYSPLITRGSAVRAQLVTLLFLSTHNP